jgi:hypothetical protein
MRPGFLGFGILGHRRDEILSDQYVQQLIAYCQRRAAKVAADDDQRNACEFVVRHLAVVHPRADDLHAALLLWCEDRRRLAQDIRQQGVGLALADTLETAGQVFADCTARLEDAHRQDKAASRAETFPWEGEQAQSYQHTLRVELWLRVENNSKFVRGKKRSRAEIEDRVLRRYAMEKLWQDRGVYYLTIPYDTEEDLERTIDELLREAWMIADDRACFMEADVRALDGSERSW